MIVPERMNFGLQVSPASLSNMTKHLPLAITKIGLKDGDVVPGYTAEVGPHLVPLVVS